MRKGSVAKKAKRMQLVINSMYNTALASIILVPNLALPWNLWLWYVSLSKSELNLIY